MGLFKKIKKAVGKVAEKAIKPIAKPLRKPIAGLLGSPLGATFTGGASLLLNPERMGVKNKRSQRLYTGGQKISRGMLAAGAAVGGGALLAGGAAGGTAAGGGGLLSSLGGTAGKMGLSMLASKFMGGGGGQGEQGGGGMGLGTLAGLYGGYQGMKGSEAAEGDISRYEGGAESLINRQTELSGLDPVVAAQMKHQASQDLRAAQAERGIYESGVGAKQEAELMPQIDQQQRAWQLQQLAGISGQYSPLMESAGRRAGTYQNMAGGFGQALAGPTGGGGGGGFSLSDLAGKAWNWGSSLFGGGGEDQGYDLGTASLAGQGYGGSYY